jgi:ribosomal 50S subunit-recycling heat shock protein
LRIDLFLKLVGVAKTRMAAKRMCEAGLILRDGKALRPSDTIQPGQSLGLSLPEKSGRLQVLGLPPGKSLARKDRPQFVVFDGLDEG